MENPNLSYKEKQEAERRKAAGNSAGWNAAVRTYTISYLKQGLTMIYSLFEVMQPLMRWLLECQSRKEIF